MSDLIKHLKLINRVGYNAVNDKGVHLQAAEEIEQLQAQVKQLEQTNQWISVEDETPNYKQNVIAIGTWWGEISGLCESEYIGTGEWRDGSVDIDSDTYSTEIHLVTHWMPLPNPPKEG